MHTLTARHTHVNLRALDAQARAQFGDLWLGASTRGGELVAYFADGTTKEALSQAQALLDAHDAHPIEEESHPTGEAYPTGEQAPPTPTDALLQAVLARVARLERALAELQAIK
mgnify:CR=1 FL=1